MIFYHYNRHLLSFVFVCTIITHNTENVKGDFMKKTSKSANLYAVNDLRYEDIAVSECKDDEVLVS